MSKQPTSVPSSTNNASRTSNKPMAFSVLTLLASENQTRFVEIVSLPSNTITHSIQVSVDSWFIRRDCKSQSNTTENSKDGNGGTRIYFAERELGSSSEPTRISIRAISETNPSEKIRSLIQIGQFEEAAAFAKQIGLDMQFLLKAKLLHSVSNEAQRTVNFEDILRDLDQIEDDVFCLEFCLTAQLSCHTSTHRLLSYGRNRNVNATATGYSSLEDLEVSVQQAVRRLGTFQTISLHDKLRMGDPSVINSASMTGSVDYGLEFNGAAWQAFRTMDLVDVLQDLISRGDLKSVVFIWRRHCVDDDLINHLMEVLNALPETCSVNELISWLQIDIIPNILSTELYVMLAEWMQQRCRVIEAHQARPHEALALISLLDAPKSAGFSNNNSLLKRDYQTVKPVTPAYYVQNTISFAQKSDISTFGFNAWAGKGDILKLKGQLEDLVHLWNEHDFKVILSEYHQSSPSSIALDLLDRVASYELLPEAIENNFRPYVARHKLNSDYLLNEYCLEVMDKSVGLGKILAGGPWETRVLSLLEFIADSEVRASILLELMYRTPVPWSENIDKKIVQAMQEKSSTRFQDIVEQYRLMRLKRTLLNHGVGHFNISDTSKSKSLLMFILAKNDSLSAMKEAMQIVSIYPQLSKLDAYIIRLRMLFEAGELERGLMLLKTGYETEMSQLPDEAVQTEVDQQLDVDIVLDSVSTLTAGEEIMSWLVEVMDCAVTEEEKYEHLAASSKSSFTWAVTTALELSSFIQKRKSKCKDDFRNQSVPKSSIVATQQNLIASHLAALEMANSYCSVETIKAIRNLKELSVEFNIRISLQVYRYDEAARRVVLNRFAKEVFKYGTESQRGTSTPTSTTDFSRTELYRLAELLGFERSSLDGIIAEEAARNGDVKTALLLCKELYEKSPDSTSAATLKNIALLLTSFAAENKDMFKDIKETKTNFRLTKWILELSQKSLSVCDEDLIGDSLDDFKNYEILHAIFTQCDAGDYGTLLSTSKEKSKAESPRGYGNAGGSSGSSAMYGGCSGGYSSDSPPITSLSSFPVKWSLSTKLSDRSLDLDVANIGDDFGSSLFDEHYHEGGLVLPTEKAMGLATGYVLDLASVASRQAEADINERLGGLTSPAKSKNKGVAAAVCDPISSGQELSMYLKSNRVLIAALRMWHRTVELRVRSSGILKDLDLSESTTEADTYGHLQLVKNLAENIFSSRFIDQNLAFGGLLTIPTETAFNVFKVGMSTTGKDYDRLLKFSAVGVAAGLAWNQRGFQVGCQDMAKNARWWHQFNLLNITVQTEMFSSTSDEYQRSIIPILLKKTGLDIPTALEFARTYKIEDDFVIFEYVRQLLLNSSDNREYKYRVAGVIDDIANKPLLISLLYQVITACSPYDYERISFVYNQILVLDKDDQEARKGIRVLEILSPYTRRNPPNVSEFEGIMDTKQLRNKAEDPTRASFCAIFLGSSSLTVIEKGWEVIQPEVHESTLSRLLPLSVPLSIPTDQFYISVVEGFVARLNGNNKISPSFSDIKPFLTKIQDTLIAAKKTVLVAEAFVTGPDRIAAFKQALVFCERLISVVNESTPPEQSAKYQQYQESIAFALVVAETDYQLKCHGLDEFWELSSHPVQLIEELYRTKSEDALSSEGALDLHSIVNVIGSRHGLNVESIRNRLLQTGLLQDAVVTSEEKDLYLPSMRVQINNLLNSDSERLLQLQLLYIARSVPVQLGMQFFLTGAYNPTSKIQTLHRIRSLSLLFQLASPQDFEEAGKCYEEIRGYTQMLLYLIDFEELRIVQSIKEFNECDKESLARSLWLNHGGEPKVVQLICNLCLDYGILDLTLWENALTRLIKLGAVRYLAGIIEPVTAVPELARMKNLPNIWNRVLGISLEEVINKKDRALYERVLMLVQKCPFVYDLDIGSLVDSICGIVFEYEESNAVDDTILLLKGISVFPPHRAVVNGLKKIVESVDSVSLVQVLSRIARDVATGIGGLEFANLQIFSLIHNRREYSAFESNVDEGRKLVKYLIAIGETEPLVLEMRNNGRDREADEIETCMQQLERVF
ncbi:UNVERIFIED_CONTAM: Kinetochore-associated protein 1 [Siphonaria sp. JEL0065]|nr:Kinetochore-associated protein 1 [Siphonaria sp. JEL0065]